jgi:carbon monoxide dehydrogenase subunit G
MELTNDFHVNVPLDRAWAVLTDVERIAPCMPGAQLEEIEGNEYRGGVKIKVGPITAQYKGKATFLEKDDINHKAVLRAEGRDTKGQGNASATITATLVAAGTGTDVKVSTDLTITGKVAQFGRGVLADVSAKILGQFVTCLEHDVLVRPEETLAAVASASAEHAAPVAAVAGVAAAVGAVTAGAVTAGAVTAEATSPVTATEVSAAAVSAAPTATAPAASPSTSASSSGAADAPAADTKPPVRKIEYKAAEPVDLLDAAGSPVLKRAAPVVAILVLLFFLFGRRAKK